MKGIISKFKVCCIEYVVQLIISKFKLRSGNVLHYFHQVNNTFNMNQYHIGEKL